MTLDHELEHLIDRATDGDLSAEETARLEAAAERPEVAAALARHRRLDDLLAAGRVQARAGFTEAVVASLGVPPWQVRSHRALAIPLAVLAAMLVAAFGLVLLAAPQLDASGVGILGALAEFAVATVVSGAGLLAASWRGLGLAVGELALPVRITLAVGVVFLDLLLLSLLRRSPERAGRGRREEG